MALIEDVMHAVGMTTANRTTGRKPAGYRPIRTLEEVKVWVVEDALDSADGSRQKTDFIMR